MKMIDLRSTQKLRRYPLNAFAVEIQAPIPSDCPYSGGQFMKVGANSTFSIAPIKKPDSQGGSRTLGWTLEAVLEVGNNDIKNDELVELLELLSDNPVASNPAALHWHVRLVCGSDINSDGQREFVFCNRNMSVAVEWTYTDGGFIPRNTIKFSGKIKKTAVNKSCPTSLM